jgi:hypothetical protein
MNKGEKIKNFGRRVNKFMLSYFNLRKNILEELIKKYNLDIDKERLDELKHTEKVFKERMADIPRIVITHKDKTKSVAILEHSLKTHSFIK